MTIEKLIDPTQHPIALGNQYVLNTPPVKVVKKTVKELILQRLTGAYMVGNPRIGKTWAIKALKQYLQDIFGDIPIYSYICTNHAKATDKQFYTNLLTAIGHALANDGTGYVKKNRLLSQISTDIEQCQKKMAVMIIDEAHFLLEADYDWLINIYNELESRGYFVFYFLVGQKELLHRIEEFRRNCKKQIIGRFMVHPIPFHGLRTVDEVTAFLKCYDQIEYPSGITYTQFFFPEAFEEDHRLAELADKVFYAFDEIRRQANVSENTEIPAKYATGAIEYIFKNYGKGSSKTTHWITPAMIAQAVAATHYAELEVGVNLKIIPQ